MQQLNIKQGFNKNIIIVILALLLTITTLMLYISYTGNGIINLNKNSKVSSTVVLERITNIWELASTKYYYSNVLAFKESLKINNMEIPFTEKGYMIKYDGYVKTGVDLKSLRIDSNDGNSIKISVEHPRILDHVIDEKSVFVYDEKNSIFNNINIKDIFDKLSIEKQNTEKKLLEKGFLEQCETNTKMLLEGMLKNMGFENVEVNFY